MCFDYGDISGSSSALYAFEKALCDRKWWGGRVKKSLKVSLERALLYSCMRLGYYPIDFKCSIRVFDDTGSFRQKQIDLYDKVVHPQTSAFVSLSRNTVYVIGGLASRNRMRHEFGHLLLHKLVCERHISYKVHECVAQFCEK